MEGYKLIFVLVAVVSLSEAQTTAPANILIAPRAPADFYGGRLSIPCAAIGWPAPNITWSSQPLGISDLNNYFGSLAVNVVTRQTRVGEGTVTISILEICNANYTLADIDGLITCTADNGVPPTTGTVSTVSVSLTPEVTEPATLVAAPQNRYLYNGSRLVATCVARGSPKASITWSAPTLNIADFSNTYVSFASFSVSSTDVRLGSNNTIHTVSTLEICADNVQVLAQYFVPISCSAQNSRSMTPSVVSFTPQPYNEFLGYSISAGASTSEVTFDLAGPYDSTILGCFLHKLVFSNSADNVFYQPVYSGTCVNLSPNQVTASLDSRDYINMIRLQFFVRYNFDIVVSTAPEYHNFGTPFIVTPINASTSLRPNSYVVSSQLPRMSGFDLDLSSRLLFLHFSGVMEFTSFTLNQLAFIITDAQTQQRQEYRLMDSQPLSTTGSQLYSFCIALSEDDINGMRIGGFCTSPENCNMYFPMTLVTDVFSRSVSGVSQFSPLRVALFTPATPPPLPAVYMEVMVSVSGCERTRVLEPNEMYISKHGKSLISVSCVARIPETNPFLSWSPLQEALSDVRSLLDSESFEFSWPNRVTYTFADGLNEANQGLFNCTTTSGASISNYIVTSNPYISLDNDTYNVQLFDDVNIPVYFGSYPPIDLRDPQVDVSLVLASGGDPAPVEPNVGFSSPHFSMLSFSNIDYRIQSYEQYEVRVIRSGVVLASTELTINIRDPTINIIPPVAAVLPTDIRVTFRCVTNSPDLPVIWVAENLRTEVAAGPTLSTTIPSGGLDDRTFICAVRDPTPSTNNPFIVSYKNATVRSVQDPLTVFRDGVQLGNNSVTVTNRFSGSLNLTCLGHHPTNNVDLNWIIVPDGDLPRSAEMNTTRYNVSYEENVAILMIDNRLEPFRGAIKCVSARSGAQVNVFVKGEPNNNPDYCPSGDRDEVWGIVWGQVLAGGRDIQPCPSLDGNPTSGFASRSCSTDGVWIESVDVSGCSSQTISVINNMLNDLLMNSDRLPISEVNNQISGITQSLLNLTTVSNVAQFTQDLQVSNNIIENIITILNTGASTAPPESSFHDELVDVLNNLLNVNNIQGWMQLEESRPGTGQIFLSNIQNYGYYMMQALTNANIDTSQYGDTEITIEREYIYFNVRRVPSTDIVDIVYPTSDSSIYSEGRLTLSADLLEEQRSTGAIIIVIQNIGDFLSDPSNTIQNITSLVSSNVISAQLVPPGSVPFENNLVEIYLESKPILGAVNPRGAYFVPDFNGAGSWETQDLVSGAVVNGERGESKSYQVSFSARLTGAFAVIVDQVTVDFNLTVPVYVGCGVVIFSAVMSLFCLLLSCFVDSVRKYFTTAFFIHVSFIFSLLAAYVAFLVGIELGLDNRIGCAAVAAVLHYFFTAAFTWLLFEAVLVMLFGTLSTSWKAIFLLFLLGWGIPIIPTAVSVGILHGEYGTSQHCWFFFDGVVGTPVVLGFIIPKLLIIALTVVVLVISVCTNFKFQMTKQQPHVKRPYTCMLWFVWLSTVFMLLLLAASWVFLLLLVNVYGLDSTILGWIFMGVTIGLGIYMFLFSFVVLIVNQKIDYRYMWDEKSDTYVGDPHKGRDYEIMKMPSQSHSPKLGPVSRPIVIDNPVFDDKAPPLADAPPPGDDDSFDNSDDEKDPEKPTNLDDSVDDEEDGDNQNTHLVN